jgi:hypothetical protein
MWNEKHLWIVVNVYAKYHHLVPNGSKVIERTQHLPYTIGSQLWSKSVTLAFDLEIWTCNATHPWMVMYIYAKYHNLAPNGSQIIERGWGFCFRNANKYFLAKRRHFPNDNNSWAEVTSWGSREAWYRVIRVLPRWQISLWHFRCLCMGKIDVITYKYVINGNKSLRQSTMI